MPNNKKKLSKEEKHKLSHVKMRMNEQAQEVKVNKKVSKQIRDRVIAHPKLLTYKVIDAGVRNKYAEAETKYIHGKKEFIKEKRFMLNAFAQKVNPEKKAFKVKLAKAKTPEAKRKIKNDYLQVERQQKKDKAYIDKKIAEGKSKVLGLKKLMLAQKTIMNHEVKEIFKLNKTSKGQVGLKNNKGAIIDVKNAQKIYASKGNIFKALRVEELTIKKGTFNVILGPSGSGKTTLLNMISGLDRATAGDVIVNNVNIAALTTSQLTQFRRNEIGFVFQSYNLLSSLNVNDNIEVGRSLQNDPKMRKSIDALLGSIDMEDNKRKRTYELSGGQQQRVSIARALSKSPSILIGDEPTGALDTNTSLKVFELFQEINKKQNATVIIVTHNTNVAKLADQVIYVKDGEIEKVVQNENPRQAAELKSL